MRQWLFHHLSGVAVGLTLAQDARIAELNKEVARLNNLLDSALEWYKLPGVVVTQKLEIARLTAERGNLAVRLGETRKRLSTLAGAAQALVDAMEACHICSVQMESLTCCGIPTLHAALKAALEGKC